MKQLSKENDYDNYLSLLGQQFRVKYFLREIWWPQKDGGTVSFTRTLNLEQALG